MRETPYSRFDASSLILRDELAIDRTLLANERTLMAYLRSGMALLIAGASIMHFSAESWFSMVGFACIPIGLFTGVFGALRFRKMNRQIALIRTLSTTGQPDPSA